MLAGSMYVELTHLTETFITESAVNSFGCCMSGTDMKAKFLWGFEEVHTDITQEPWQIIMFVFGMDG